MSAKRTRTRTRRPPPKQVHVPEMGDSWEYTRDTILKVLALLIFVIAAAYQYARGFIEGVLESRENYLLAKEESAKGETPFPAQPRPVSATDTPYEVVLQNDSEVTVNGIPIGYIAPGPWQFCSYTEPPAPARESKMRAFDDACDYAEAQARTFHSGRS